MRQEGRGCVKTTLGGIRVSTRRELVFRWLSKRWTGFKIRVFRGYDQVPSGCKFGMKKMFKLLKIRMKASLLIKQ